MTNKCLITNKMDKMLIILALAVNLVRAEVFGHDNSSLPIEVIGLGRVAQLGSLYDLRTDTFVRSSLFTSSLPTASILDTQNSRTDFRQDSTQTFTSKAEALNVQLVSQLGVCLRMIEWKASGAFFKDQRKSARVDKVTLVVTTKTNYTEVNINDLAVKSLIDQKALYSKQATHVVVAVQYGGTMFATFEHNTEANSLSTRTGFKTKISKILPVLFPVRATAKVGFSLTEQDVQYLANCSFTVNGDLHVDTVPQTWEKRIEFLRTAPTLLRTANGGRGVPVSYIMLPLSAVRRLVGGQHEDSSLEVRRETELMIRQVVNWIEQTDKVKQRLNDLVSDVDAFEGIIDSEEVNKVKTIKSKFEENRIRLEARLTRFIIDYRSWKQSEDQLGLILESDSASDYSYLNVANIDFSKLNNEIIFLKLFQELGVSLLPNGTRLSQVLFRNTHLLYVFYYRYDTSTIQDKITLLFRHLIQENVDTSTRYLAINLKAHTEIALNTSARISVYKGSSLLVDEYDGGQQHLTRQSDNQEDKLAGLAWWNWLLIFMNLLWIIPAIVYPIRKYFKCCK